MAGVDTNALINSLTEGMRTLHAHDQKLQAILRRVQTTRKVGPDEFEAILSAQQASLRIPANALLMLAGWLEAWELRGPPPTPSVPTRARRAVRVLLGRE